jgi:hypothetical protein
VGNAVFNTLPPDTFSALTFPLQVGTFDVLSTASVEVRIQFSLTI